MIYLAQRSICIDNEGDVLATAYPVGHAESLRDPALFILDHWNPHIVPGHPLPVCLRLVGCDSDYLNVQLRKVVQQAAELNGDPRSGNKSRDPAVKEFID